MKNDCNSWQNKIFQEYSYTRCGNPTRDIVAKSLASLDNGKYGLVYSSAMCATTSIIQTLNTGDHIIVCSEVYSGVKKVFTEATSRNGMEVEFIDAGCLDDIKNAIKNNTRVRKCIFVEIILPNLKLISFLNSWCG
ncbi:hypothetical protein EON73_04595 [bacterium]|nr:MAG: hypothetical protein EON73_04595 [bacterium]